MRTGAQGRPDDDREPEIVAIEPLAAGAGLPRVPRTLVVIRGSHAGDGIVRVSTCSPIGISIPPQTRAVPCVPDAR